MQKFRPRCLVRIFCNERSRSTLLDPKLMFWCVSFRSGAFWTVSLLHETWCKSAKLVQLMQKFMPQCRSRIFRNECSRSTPLDPKLMFCFVLFLSVWGHLEPFCYCMKLAAKRAKLVQLMQKFVPWCLVRIFATNAPDPHQWSLNSCFVAFLSVRVHFGTVLLLHETWCKTRQTGAINAKVCATMSC